MVSSTVLTLLVIPAIYGLVKGWRLPPAEKTESLAAQPVPMQRQAAVVE
jgi:Cu(I)/Ag(I) efflux system membrane protein CusA/SilA